MRRVGWALCVIILIGCSRMSATSSLPTTNQPATSSSSFQTLHVFTKEFNGIVPVGVLLPLGGNLYGTTNFGGDSNKDCSQAHQAVLPLGSTCGTVYKINAAGKEKVLYRFTGDTSGIKPYAGMVDVKGMLYGTTQEGGKHNEGTVFAITTAGSESVVYQFDGKYGEDPRATLMTAANVLYGTTYYGGAAGAGTVFSLTTSGSEKVLHSFKSGTDGALPLGTLIDVNNVLYGTTSSGGASDDGTVFEVGPTGSNYSVLYSFKGGADGAYPFAGLLDVNGTLYGTTQQGGTHNEGTVFTITPSGSENVIYSFGGGTDGTKPFAGLTLLNNQLYGTTGYGGSEKEGTIYTITPSGSESVLHNFDKHYGRVPYATLTVMSGALYGTTLWGGRANLGSVFKFSP